MSSLQLQHHILVISPLIFASSLLPFALPPSLPPSVLFFLHHYLLAFFISSLATLLPAWLQPPPQSLKQPSTATPNYPFIPSHPTSHDFPLHHTTPSNHLIPSLPIITSHQVVEVWLSKLVCAMETSSLPWEEWAMCTLTAASAPLP